MASISTSTDSRSSENWFVATADAGTLELSLEGLTGAIKAGKVPVTALVWRAGMSDWIELDRVPLLQLVVAQLELSPTPDHEALPPPVATLAPVIDESDEADATIVQAAPVAFVSAPVNGESVPRALLPEQVDNDLTIVTSPPREFKANPATTAPRLDDAAVVLNDDEWTVEPQATRPRPGIKQPLSIHDLVSRGGALASATGRSTASLSRPILVRPSTNKPTPRADDAGLTAESAPVATTGEKLETSEAAASSPNVKKLSERAPPKPQRESAAGTPTPVAAASEPVEARALTPAAKTAKVTAAASARNRTSAAPSPQAPRSGTPSASPPPTRIARSPSSAPARPTPIAAPITAKALSTQPPAPPVAALESIAARESFADKPPAPATAPARRQEANPTATAAVAALPVAAPAVVAIAPSIDAVPVAESLAPSVAALLPDNIEWRRPRRPIYMVVAAAILGIFALVLVGSTSRSTRQSGSAAATRLDATASPNGATKRSRDPAEPAPAEQTAHDIADQTPQAQTEDTTPSERRLQPRSLAASPKVDQPLARPAVPQVAATGQNSPRHADKRATTVVDETETKRTDSDRSTVEPASAKPAKKAQPSAASVAAWDEGTAESRSWMSPGF